MHWFGDRYNDAGFESWVRATETHNSSNDSEWSPQVPFDIYFAKKRESILALNSNFCMHNRFHTESKETRSVSSGMRSMRIITKKGMKSMKKIDEIKLEKDSTCKIFCKA